MLHHVVASKFASYYGSIPQQPTLRLFAPHHSVYEPALDHDKARRVNTDSLTLLLLSATDGRETIVDLTQTLAEMSQNGKLSPGDITMDWWMQKLAKLQRSHCSRPR